MVYEKFGSSRSSRVAWSSCMPMRFSKFEMHVGLAFRIMDVRRSPRRTFVDAKPFWTGNNLSISSSKVFCSTSDRVAVRGTVPML
uniref:Uncharacterized protein n=1 Tax=Arundo donax TaxID=35708 RepID=A0A0A9FLC7_ARUDO